MIATTSTAPCPKRLSAVKRRLEPFYLNSLADIATRQGAAGVDTLLAPFLAARRDGPLPLGPIRCYVVDFYRAQLAGGAA